MDDETRKQQPTQYQREIRCPVHNRLLGRYDARNGVTNVTYYCPICKQEYTFTIKKEGK